MLLNIFPCTGQTPLQRIMQPKMSVVPRLRIPGWVPGVSEHVHVVSSSTFGKGNLHRLL